MSQADGILFEIEDNFQNKRTAIALISIVLTEFCYWTFLSNTLKPITKGTKDIQVDSDVDWQKQHYKSLETAYEDLLFFFLKTTSVLSSKKAQILLDLNFETLEIISKCLRVKFDYITTSEYATAVEV
jgi:hypothetical protein